MGVSKISRLVRKVTAMAVSPSSRAARYGDGLGIIGVITGPRHGNEDGCNEGSSLGQNGLVEASGAQRKKDQWEGKEGNSKLAADGSGKQKDIRFMMVCVG